VYEVGRRTAPVISHFVFELAEPVALRGFGSARSQVGEREEK
jgi:hypothetical protein